MQEAVALAEAALAVGGQSVHPMTRGLIAGVIRSEMPVEQAIERVVAHHIGSDPQ